MCCVSWYTISFYTTIWYMFVFSVNLSIKCLQIRSDIIMFSFKAYCQIEDFFFCYHNNCTNQTNTRRLYFWVIVSNVHVLSNLKNELRKNDRMRGSVNYLSVFVHVTILTNLIKQKFYLSYAAEFVMKVRFFQEFCHIHVHTPGVNACM